MNLHSSGRKGTIALLNISSDLCKKGFYVAHVLNETCPYDLIINIQDRCYRVQVKYKAVKRKKIEIDSRRSGAKIKKPYKKTDFDMYAIYCPNTNSCYYFFNKGNLSSHTVDKEKDIFENLSIGAK